MSDTPGLLTPETEKKPRNQPLIAGQDTVAAQNHDGVTYHRGDSSLDGISNMDGIYVMNFVPVVITRTNAKGQTICEVVRMTREEYALYLKKNGQSEGKTSVPANTAKGIQVVPPAKSILPQVPKTTSPVNKTTVPATQAHKETLPVAPVSTAHTDGVKHPAAVDNHAVKALPVKTASDVTHNAVKHDEVKKEVHAPATPVHTVPPKKEEGLLDHIIDAGMWAAHKLEHLLGEDAVHKPATAEKAAPGTKHSDIDISGNVTYVTQYNTNIPLQSGAQAGPGPKGCYNACLYMGNQAGAKPVPGWGGIFMGTEKVKNSYQISPTATASKGLNYINEQLDKKRPVIVGVGRQLAGYEGSRSGAEKDAKGTDHFLVIVGRKTDANGVAHYRFYDPGAYESMKASGSAAKNILSVDSQGLLRGKSYGAEMVVSYVALNGGE